MNYFLDRHSPFVFYITGSIGAGKSTILTELIDFFELSNVELISADVYFSKYFFQFGAKIDDGYQKAKKFMSYKINKVIEQQHPFIWETVVAKDNKISLLKSFKEAGYYLIGIFVGVNEHNIIVKHLLNRVVSQLYEIPEWKSISRFNLTNEYQKSLNEISNSFIAIDNSSTHPKIVYCRVDDHEYLREKTCPWLNI